MDFHDIFTTSGHRLNARFDPGGGALVHPTHPVGANQKIDDEADIHGDAEREDKVCPGLFRQLRQPEFHGQVAIHTNQDHRRYRKEDCSKSVVENMKLSFHIAYALSTLHCLLVNQSLLTELPMMRSEEVMRIKGMTTNGSTRD